MPIRKIGQVILATVASLGVLAACGAEDAPGSGSGGPTPSETTSVEPTTPAVTETPSNPAPQSVIDQSIAMLADKLGVAPEEIDVVRAIEIEWRDGSIGCAKKGMGYTDAIVPGALVELSVDGKTYAFHQGQQGTATAPFYCKRPTEPLGDQ